MSVFREARAVREHVGIWGRDTHTVLQFSGKDAAGWLQSQTTNDVLALRSGQGAVHCLLDRKGRVQTVFTLHRWQDEFWAVIEKVQRPALEARIESHLFLEDVTCADVGAGGLQIAVEGPNALFFLAELSSGPDRLLETLPAAPYAFAPVSLLGHDLLAFRMTESGEDGFLFLPAPDEAAAFLDELAAHAREYMAEIVSEAGRAALLLEAGPRFGPDIDSDTVISETPLANEAVSHDKGCYLGQEVVARLKAYGSPKRLLCGLHIEDDDYRPLPIGTELFAGGKRVGRLRSSGFSPALGRHAGYAYLDREHRTPGMRLDLETDDEAHPRLRAVVVHAPLYTPKTRAERARDFYDAALARFERDAEDVDDTAIELLEKALTLDPGFEDAYEVIGVILHRHHRVDEAIAYMRRLDALNPDNVMAHTNLSVFYMTKGMIREAEEEKAKAGQLEMRQRLDARAASELADVERARIRDEARQRIGMFREVLELDPDDALAAMGLGAAHLQLEEHAEAASWIERAIAAQPDYSAAYLKLGQCREALGDASGARAAYRDGIAAASRKGDMMPMREMERRLKALESAKPPEANASR